MLEIKTLATIKQLRIDSNLSQIELANKAGVTPPVVVRAEQGKPILLHSAMLLCAALDVKLEDVDGVVIKKRRLG